MAFYLIGPFMGYGTKMEPLLALGIAAVWGIYGGIYFLSVQQEDRQNDAGVKAERDAPALNNYSQ